ncbi:unnamed protein product [Chilo suppressalis]|uniref:THAP-type domain-containing protein n=1 Tax=Chilo suppressalis TaxID=168631 RepID=A0ABN8L804_CHISP|nr:unnamed protein product [Chilo suppressalis]
MGGKTKHKCEICGVSISRKGTSGIFLARFPLEPNRCRSWVKSTGNEDLAYIPLIKLNQNRFICGDHFPHDMFNENRSRLKKNAVPTLNLRNPPLSDDILANFPMHAPCHKKKDITLHSSTVAYTFKSKRQRKAPKLKKTKKDLSHECPPTSKLKDENVTHYQKVQHQIEKNKIDILVECLESNTKVSTKYGNIPGIEDNNDTKKNNIDILVDCLESNTKVSTEYVNIPVIQDNNDTIEYVIEDNNDTIEYVIGDINDVGCEYSSIEISTSKRKLQKHIKKLQLTRKLLKALSNSSFNLDSLESDFPKNIVNETPNNQARESHGKRWNIKTKIICSQIFKRSPSTYYRLQCNIIMPSVRTVRRILQSLPMEPGITPAILKQLQDKAITMLPETKLCTLIFAVISLKKQLLYNDNADKVEGFVDYGPGVGQGRRNEIADKCIVFMIQGIQKKYKQPMAFYFVKGNISSQHLSSLISNIIKVLEDATFTVVATVCNQGPTNWGALSQLKQNAHVPSDANYFYLNNRKIYIIFDVPHLFKSIRNNFREAGIMEMDRKRAKWQHLHDAEEINRRMLYFHKIIPLLLSPNQNMKRKVKYAAQTLSNTFAAILKMIAVKHIGTQYGQDIEQTSAVICDLNNLFDITNGPAHPEDVIKGKRENISDKTNHLHVWNDFLKKISTIEFLKNDRRLQLAKVRCVQGFIITIKSLKDIWLDLQNKGFRSLNLRQLNQDSLEHFFGVIRKSSPTNRNPTCSHFASAISTVLVSSQTRRTNCENDTNKLLFKVSLKTGSVAPLGSDGDPRKGTKKKIDEYPTIMVPETHMEEQIENKLADTENQPLVYLSSYLAYRLLKGNSCQTCSDLLQEKRTGDKYKCLCEWWKDKRLLRYPSFQLCRITEVALLCFKRNLHLFHEGHVGQNFCTLMMVQLNFTWWSCNSHRYMTEKIIRLIVKILIRRQCQIYNNDLLKAE